MFGVFVWVGFCFFVFLFWFLGFCVAGVVFCWCVLVLWFRCGRMIMECEFFGVMVLVSFFGLFS